MAETSPIADLDSAAGCSNDSADSIQGSDASQPRTSNLSMHMHRVQAWLVSSSATWSSMSPQDLATSEGQRDAQAEGEGDALSEGHACATPAQQIAENATALKPTASQEHEAAVASQQPEELHQLSSDQRTTVQQHLMKQSAEQSASSPVAAVANQQVSAAAAATATHRRAVHALVQRFEHMTVAGLEASKPGVAGLGLLPSVVFDKASQQRLPEVKMHAKPERAPIAATVDDKNYGKSITPSRQLQPSCTAEEEEANRLQPVASRSMPRVDSSPVCQPPEWHLNTAFEVESSSTEQAESEPASTGYNELAQPGATGVGHTAAQLWPEGLAGAADVKEGSVQRSGRASPRYAVTSHASATTVYAYCFCHCYRYCHWYCDCPSRCYHSCYCHCLYCMCVEKQEVPSWHAAN